MRSAMTSVPKVPTWMELRIAGESAKSPAPLKAITRFFVYLLANLYVKTKTSGTAMRKRVVKKNLRFPNVSRLATPSMNIHGEALALLPCPTVCHDSVYFRSKSTPLAGTGESAPPAMSPRRFREAIRVRTISAPVKI